MDLSFGVLYLFRFGSSIWILLETYGDYAWSGWILRQWVLLCRDYDFWFIWLVIFWISSRMWVRFVSVTFGSFLRSVVLIFRIWSVVWFSFVSILWNIYSFIVNALVLVQSLLFYFLKAYDEVKLFVLVLYLLRFWFFALGFAGRRISSLFCVGSSILRSFQLHFVRDLGLFCLLGGWSEDFVHLQVGSYSLVLIGLLQCWIFQYISSLSIVIN